MCTLPDIDDVGVIDRDGSEVVVARTVPSAHARIQISPEIILGHNVVSVVIALTTANRPIRVWTHGHVAPNERQILPHHIFVDPMDVNERQILPHHTFC